MAQIQMPMMMVTISLLSGFSSSVTASVPDVSPKYHISPNQTQRFSKMYMKFSLGTRAFYSKLISSNLKAAIPMTGRRPNAMS